MHVCSEAKRQAECFRLVYDLQSEYVNDHCFIQEENGLVHLFHIVGPVGSGCYDKNSEIEFGHATSHDLALWKRQENVLTIDPESEHEPHHVYAPYVLQHNGLYHMFYAGINQEAKQESLCLATSRDLYSWTKFEHNPVFLPSTSWAEHDRQSQLWACCRDPHVLRHQESEFFLYFVTWLKDTSGKLTAVGAARSSNLVTWQDAGPAVVRQWTDNQGTKSVESPCVVYLHKKYYLFYKHRDGTRLAIAEQPLRFTDRQDHWFSVAHAAEVFQIAGQWYMSSCSRDLLDLKHEYSDRSKGLFLACIEWETSVPRVVPFKPAR